jgi:SpoVK/Ycf46/Vps4 family AAA+-type ATPase
MDIESYSSPRFFLDDDTTLEETNEISSVAINLNKVKLKKFSDKLKLSFYNCHEFTEMKDSNAGYFSYCSEVNYFAYRYRDINKIYPTIYRFSELINSTKFVDNLFKYYNVPTDSYAKITYQDTSEIKLTSFFISFTNDLALFFDGVNEGVLYYNGEQEKDKDSLLYTILGLMKSSIKPKICKNKIFIVYKNSSGFEKIGFDVKKIKVELNENYNDGFTEMSEKIITGLNNKDKTHLVILSGDPGTGKTTYIRYLTSKLKKNIIFISPDMVDSITDPAFIPFLMKNNDSILIIEDAEPALKKRGIDGRSGAVSNVLNLTDGLLSDCLKISIVATFNTDEKTIDDALLRKGRLLMNYKFEKLSIKKSKVLLEKLGHKEIVVDEPMTLADIYYYGTENNVKKAPQKIGF